ncbi:thermonuclease family protein [uncultured Pseudodesulfovibrio sp.]|uniref:thermonuclease family protein n=1 Tax=uncultured Pseudodesulfovibrio sp. TaxID=2035858 RepID=UPI0029C6E475|nr:thermonuclease family protein [uncultured Pseudodesulfovibrio sp.]
MNKILLVFLFVLYCPTALAWHGVVASIVDGDTVTVVTEGGSGVRVRLYGIDCPERKQPGGKGATDYVKSVIGKVVGVEEIDRDRYGRSVSIVTISDGRVLNRMILEQGWAWVYLRYCRLPVCGEWEELEAEAREKRLGLWQDHDPVPPWEWRRK